MPHPSKRKGSDFERELVAVFNDAGLRAKRAWGSNGTTLRTDAGRPCESTVDVLVEGKLRVQAKRRASVASYLKPPPGCHLAIVREDRGESLAIIPLDLLIRLLRKAAQPQTTETHVQPE